MASTYRRRGHRRHNTFTRFVEDFIDDSRDFIDDVIDRAKDVEDDLQDAARDLVDDVADSDAEVSERELEDLRNAVAELTAKVNELAAA